MGQQHHKLNQALHSGKRQVGSILCYIFVLCISQILLRLFSKDAQTNGADKPKDGEDVEIVDKKSEEVQSEMEIDIETDKKPEVQLNDDGKTPQDDKKPTTDPEITDPTQQGAAVQGTSEPMANGRTTKFLGDLPIDVLFEASKLPLDVAIFNSARAAGGHEKIRKYLQAVLVVGGSAAIPGMSHALESRQAVVLASFLCLTLIISAIDPRLQAIATPLVPNMEKVQIIAPPRDALPHTLAWKGGAVLARMEGASDLWLSAEDWVRAFSHIDFRRPLTRSTCSATVRFERFEGALLLSVIMKGSKISTNFVLYNSLFLRINTNLVRYLHFGRRTRSKRPTSENNNTITDPAEHSRACL